MKHTIKILSILLFVTVFMLVEPTLAHANFDGTVFIDQNGNGKFDAGESGVPNVTINIVDQIPPAAYTIVTSNSGTYLQPVGCTDPYNLTLDTSTLPAGYKLDTPNPLTNQTPPCGGVKEEDFGIVPISNSNSSTTGDITTLNFGITNTYPWVQFSCGDVRMDNGIADNLPGSQYVITQNANCPSNALAFTGDSDPNIGQGQISSSNQLIGGSSYPEVFPSSLSLSTSYPALLAKAQTANISPTDLSTVCTLSSCQLPGNLPHGLYLANGDVTITNNNYTFNGNQNYVFLINGSLTLTGNISVTNGSTALFTTSANITVAANVGTPPNNANSSLDGWYVAGQNFIVNSQGNCNDLRLNIAGSVVANALENGGTFQNNRDLCGNDTTNPTVSVTQRLDMILNAPQFIEHQQTLSQELAP